MKQIPLIGFAGWSDSGKTTLIEKLIPALQRHGKQVAVIKHCPHGVDADGAGRDSGRMTAAGAVECAVCGPNGPELSEEVMRINRRGNADFIFIEGFKNADIPKIGVSRVATEKGFTEPVEGFCAVVTDSRIEGLPVPCFDLNDIERIGSFIMEHETDFIPKTQKPSLDDWLMEAKKSEKAPECGMYLFHNGVVRETPKAKVRFGEQTDRTVKAVRFSYDAEKTSAAKDHALQMPGIFYVRVWLNEGTLKVGDDLMLILVGGDIRPHVVDALQSLVGEIKNSCVIEQEIFEN